MPVNHPGLIILTVLTALLIIGAVVAALARAGEDLPVRDRAEEES